MSPGIDDPAYRETVADLLGMLACVEMAAFEVRGRDVSYAASAADKSAFGQLAVAEFRNFQELAARLDALEVDADARMGPFGPAARVYQRQTAPADFLESLVKVYIADGIAADFHRQAVPNLEQATAEVVQRVLTGDRTGELAVSRVRAAAESDRETADRLSLWARRLVGEVLGRAQTMIAVRPGLATLFVVGPDVSDSGVPATAPAPGNATVGVAAPRRESRPAAPGTETDASRTRTAIIRIFNRSTGQRTQRMRELGLSP